MWLGSIRARILVLFLLSVGAFGGAMAYSLAQLRTVGDSLKLLERSYLPLMETTVQMKEVRGQIERDGERFTRENPRPVAGHRSNVALYSPQLQAHVQSARRLAVSSARVSAPDEQEALRGIIDVIDEVEQARLAHDAAFEALMEMPADAATGQALSELGRARTELSLVVNRLYDRLDDRITQISAAARARERATAVSVTLAALATLFAAFLAGLVLRILQPIGRLTEEVQRLGAGEYSGPVALPSRDVGEEVAVLAREFNAMAAAVVERDRRLSERAAALDQLSLRLRQILDTIQAGLVVAEGDRIEVLNPAAEATWGAAASAPLPAWMTALSSGRHDGVVLGERLFDVAVVPFGDRGVLYVGEDVTERAAVRERLARAERLAVVGQMLAQITHEVRNPLNAMSLNAEILADEIPPNSEASEILETITTEIRRLEALTGRYLSLSRRRSPERSPEDPAAMVREILRLEEEALRRAGVVVTHTATETRLVELDSDALRRALRNVLLNAVEAGASTLRIETLIGDSDLTITVVDDGPGMDAAQIKQAFEPFFTTKAQGTGLGLAISRQELEDIGGSLRCESQPGAGSVFTLTCPI